ncbi:MAG TPA: DUF4388 domain-containing protein, partial [Vicinamibacteria bacterium]|nr:DUF4388 domain-containing protein [Vicinamibacteria bacterium]
MRGNLNRTTLPAILRAFYAERKTGTLHLSSHPAPCRLSFRNGRIVRVESSAESDRFGEELVKSGRLQRAELDAALELAAREGASVGKALVKSNRLTAEELRDAEIRRMSEIVHSLLASTSGEFRFEESEIAVSEEDAVELPVGQVILDGVRRISDTGVLRALIGDMSATLRTTTSTPLPVLTIKLTPGERGLLQATQRQPSSVRQVLSGSELGDAETLRALYALLSIGLLEAEGPPESPPIDKTDTTDETEKAESVRQSSSAPGAPAQEEPPPAESIPKRFGRFEIQRLLARTSTDIVLRARDPEIDRI